MQSYFTFPTNCKIKITAATVASMCSSITSIIIYTDSIAVEVGHDFRGMRLFIITRHIYIDSTVLLTQRVDLGCGGIYCKHPLIRIDDQPPPMVLCMFARKCAIHDTLID